MTRPIDKLLRMIDKAKSDIRFYREGRCVKVTFDTYKRAEMFCHFLNDVGDELWEKSHHTIGDIKRKGGEGK